MRKLLILFILLTPALFADDAPARPVFPDDYQANPCAPTDVCKSFDRYKFVAAARTFLGFTVDDRWITDHWDEIRKALEPGCAKMANCYTVFGSTFTFCNDAVVPEMRTVCDRFPNGSADRDQCLMFVEVYVLGVDQNSRPKWDEAQKCNAAASPHQTRTTPPDVWTDPPKFGPDYKGMITVYAQDPVTKLPVPGFVHVEKTTLYASGTPIGRPYTFYPFRWPFKLQRVPNAQGHTDLVAPKVTVEGFGWPAVTLTMPVELSTMVIEMQPPVEKLKRGKNQVTFVARDAKTGEPVEARIMLGDHILGDTNKPLTIELKRGQKRPEIWATSLFDRYNDVVIAPAEK